MYIPITKVDVKKRIVYGIAADETPDRQGEIWDYESNKPLWEKWSAEAAKNTEAAGQEVSLGNLRAMHGSVAAGKLAEIEFDDAVKSMEIGAKVVDDNEWEKVQAGVYTGFSVGGSYVKKWSDKALKGIKRVTIDPHEISLADLPANPAALFTAIKADGIAEQRAFKVQEREDVKLTEDVKTIKAKIDKDGPLSASTKTAAGNAAKSLWTVGNLASMLQALQFMHGELEMERDMENDGSDLPEKLADAIDELAEVFMAMADEEISELLEEVSPGEIQKENGDD